MIVPSGIEDRSCDALHLGRIIVPLQLQPTGQRGRTKRNRIATFEVVLFRVKSETDLIWKC